MAVIPIPGGDCCIGPGCCIIGFASPLLLAAIPVRSALAAVRRRAHPYSSVDRPAGGPGNNAPDGRTARALYRGVRFYQRELTAYTPRCSRTPSCSQYAAEALQRHGAGRGTWLTTRRLLRCRPGTAGGHDPVPR